jgi:hypothetical protein
MCARPIFESNKAGRLIDKFVLPMVGEDNHVRLELHRTDLAKGSDFGDFRVLGLRA